MSSLICRVHSARNFNEVFDLVTRVSNFFDASVLAPGENEIRAWTKFGDEVLLSQLSYAALQQRDVSGINFWIGPERSYFASWRESPTQWIVDFSVTDYEFIGKLADHLILAELPTVRSRMGEHPFLEILFE